MDKYPELEIFTGEKSNIKYYSSEEQNWYYGMDEHSESRSKKSGFNFLLAS